MKKVKVFKPTDIPPVNTELMGYEVSKRYYAKALTISNTEIECMAMYDFKNKYWGFSHAGIVKLIEYYIID